MRNRKKQVGAIAAIFAILLSAAGSGVQARDFLTDAEIRRVQSTQDIERLTGIYMDVSASRLRTAQDRFEGRESKPGDALEFYSQEDMLDDYFIIMDRVMLIVGDAFESPRARENVNIKRALNLLKSKSPDNLKRLSILKNLAEEKQKNGLWNRINRAIDITNDVLDGAEEGLAILAEREKEEERKRQELLRKR